MVSLFKNSVKLSHKLPKQTNEQHSQVEQVPLKVRRKKRHFRPSSALFLFFLLTSSHIRPLSLLNLSHLPSTTPISPSRSQVNFPLITPGNEVFSISSAIDNDESSRRNCRRDENGKRQTKRHKDE